MHLCKQAAGVVVDVVPVQKHNGRTSSRVLWSQLTPFLLREQIFTSGLIINALVEDAVVSEAGEVRSLVRSNLLNGNRKLLLRVYRLNLCQVTPSKLVELAEVIAGVVEIAPIRR